MNSRNQTSSGPNDESVDALETQINATLCVIGSALPPDDMQARVLRRALQAQPSEPGMFRLPMWRFAAVACGLAITTGIVVSRHNVVVERNEAAHASVIHPAITPNLTPQYPVRTQKADPHNIPNASPQAKLSLMATRGGPQPLAIPAKDTSPEDSAYAEVNAPSKPAPELPLTQQEKLLLALAHRRDATSQVAELRHPIWPLHDPEQDDDFEQFFQKPAAPTQSGDSE